MEKLKKLLENPNGKLIAIDLDGVLCHGEFWGEEEPIPNQEMINTVIGWYRRGAHIIIYTARQPKYYPQTHGWLIKYGVPFHGIAMFMKPGADVYIDDKGLNSEQI